MSRPETFFFFLIICCPGQNNNERYMPPYPFSELIFVQSETEICCNSRSLIEAIVQVSCELFTQTRENQEILFTNVRFRVKGRVRWPASTNIKKTGISHYSHLLPALTIWVINPLIIILNSDLSLFMVSSPTLTPPCSEMRRHAAVNAER